MSDAIRLHRDGPVARVVLNRPQIHNAFDDALIQELTATARELAGDHGPRVVVLAAEGKSFCAGADLNWMKRMVDYSRGENIQDSLAMAAMFEAWNTLPMPVVGRIHGAALGGGTGLVAVCDIAVASEQAVFGFTEVRLGILPAVISPFVLAKVARTHARELFLTGERFSAGRALDIGLVHHVVTADDIDTAVNDVVQQLLGAGPQAQRTIKRLIGEVVGRDPGDVRQLTAETIADARAGAEGQEGMRAFFDRRKAAWREDD